MKKFFITIAAALMLVPIARADEGMWLLPMLEKLNADAIRNLGGRLTPDQIYSINHASLKDAVVALNHGSCTAELISDEGLLITNHHCGYGTIQSLSTPEHNYLEDGWWAMNRSEEMRTSMSVTFLQSMTEVTEEVNKAYNDAARKYRKKKNVDELATKAMNEAIAKIRDAARAANPKCEVSVTSFYNNNVYYLIISKTYNDVRFVGTPPASSGKFGGETDNWMWPRHTCDFSMFRVYAGPDNEPAAYSPDNKPYKPVQSLKVSLKGYKDGDYAMIMGYPGTTRRFQTASQLERMMETQEVRINARTIRQDIMWDAMMADPVVNLQYASKYAGSSNGWKKYIGMRESFGKLNIIGREEQKEAEFMKWVAADPARVAKYGTALADITEAGDAAAEANVASAVLSESIGNIELLGFARSFGRGRGGMMVPQAAQQRPAAPAALDVEAAKSRVAGSYKDYNAALDKKEAEALIAFYIANAKPEHLISVPGHDITDVEAYVDYLFKNSAFTSAEKMKSQIKTEEDYRNDPATILAEAMTAVSGKLRPANYEAIQKLNAKGSKAFGAGLLEWKAGEPSYPDANSTMRLTYGTIKSYSPKDGVLYNYYTTLKGVMEKENPDDYQFRVPAKLKEIYEKKDFGPYVNEYGEVPTCFLSTCDITGGNSGSPIMDADGNLIGLAFDGNWESMSSDIMFEPDLQRCISVDIRFVLLMIDKFGGAGYLVNEMNIVR